MRTLNSYFTKRNVFGQGKDRAVVSSLGMRMISAAQHLSMRRHTAGAFRPHRTLTERARDLARHAQHWCLALAGLRLCPQSVAPVPRPSMES